ncbi:ABC transporter substrate-binding protein [Halanaerobaculum tunisiense]
MSTKNKYLILTITFSLIITLSITASAWWIFGASEEEEKTNVLEQDWKQIVKEAEGTIVNFYMWGGNRTINNWVDTYVASQLKKRYDIKLNRVPMGPKDYLNKLLGEKQINKQEGSIDLLWINGENFKTARQKDLLFGPFVDKLPNYHQYIDANADKNTTDFGFPTEGYEAPYNRAQFVFIYDQAKVANPPQNFAELISWIKEHPGKFTYPALPDFTGSAFVRHVIYRKTGGYQQYYEMSEEEVRKTIRPALEFLAKLEPYLWRQGETYPATSAQLDNLFADGEVWMSMGYDPSKATAEIKKGNYPETARTFVLEKGTIANTNFLAIPFNAPNKPGSLVTANFLESFAAQYSKYKPDNWGALPVFDTAKLAKKERAKLEKLDLGKATLSPTELNNHSVPEIPADLVPIIEDEWQEIVGQ